MSDINDKMSPAAMKQQRMLMRWVAWRISQQVEGASQALAARAEVALRPVAK